MIILSARLMIFTVFYTGVLVLLLKGSAWLGDLGDWLEPLLRISTFLCYGGAAWLVWSFFQGLRENVQSQYSRRHEQDVYEVWWRHSLQVILMGFCYQALCLAKTNLDFQSWENFRVAYSEAMHIEGGLFFVSVFFCGVLAVLVQYARWLTGTEMEDSQGYYLRSKLMMLGVRIEYTILPVFFVWSLHKSTELTELLGVLEIPNWMICVAGIVIGQWCWITDTIPKARL